MIDLNSLSLVMHWLWLVSFGVRCFNERCILESHIGLERVTESNSLLLEEVASSNPLRYMLKVVRVWVFPVSSNFQLSLFLICSYSFFVPTLSWHKSVISFYLYFLSSANKKNISLTIKAFYFHGHLRSCSPHIPARIQLFNFTHQVLIQRHSLLHL